MIRTPVECVLRWQGGESAQLATGRGLGLAVVKFLSPSLVSAQA